MFLIFICVVQKMDILGGQNTFVILNSEFWSAWLDCNIGAVTLADFSSFLHSFLFFGLLSFVPFNFLSISFLCACLSTRVPTISSALNTCFLHVVSL